jgi:MFS family permease
MTTPARGLRLRSRLGTRCFLRQHGDVDHDTRVLSVAGATLAPSTLSLIRNMFLDPDQHAFAIGVWATSFAAGAAIGPLAGGVLEFFWWGSMFLLAVPVMALLLVLGPVLLPECRDPGAGWTSSAQRCYQESDRDDRQFRGMRSC